MFQSNADSYDRIAADWAQKRDSKPVDDCVREFAARLPSGGYVLDIGCGTGAPIDVFSRNRDSTSPESTLPEG